MWLRSGSLLSPEADRALVQATLPGGTQLQAAVEFNFSVSEAESDHLRRLAQCGQSGSVLSLKSETLPWGLATLQNEYV